MRHPLRSPSLLQDPERYAAWLESAVRRHAIDAVLPVTEGTTHLLAELYDGRVGDARVVGPGRAAYRALCDKDGLAATARRAGVAVPAGVVVTAAPGVPPLPEPPCVVKPVSSATPTAAGVVYRSAAIAPDLATRDRLVREMVASVGAVVVQPLIEGRRWRLHFARSRAGFVAIAWRTVASSPRSTGMSSVSRMVAVPEEMARAGSRLTAAAGYRGIGSLQFIETADGFVVHDANLRAVYTVGAAIAAGLDLPVLAVAIALDEPCPDLVSVRPTRYVWLAGEVQGIVEDLRAGRRRGALAGVAELAGAAVMPGRVVDPCDPVALIDTARRLLRRRGAVAGPSRAVEPAARALARPVGRPARASSAAAATV
jgi:predicted ATP-grasp superfamily ATP-dependent carboligase